MSSSPSVSVDAAVPVRRKSRLPARLDFLQSASGLALALFMWGHMFFVSSILLGKDAMWTITRFFEGYFFFGRAYPGIVSFVVAIVIVLLRRHAFLAVRKFPINYAQWRLFRSHMAHMKHEDTTLWFWQVVTGFALFFLATIAPVHHAHAPGEYRPVTSPPTACGAAMYWPLYLVLLFAVEMHGGIGLYRLCVKWGWFGTGRTRGHAGAA